MAKLEESSQPLPGVKQSRFALQFEDFCHRFGFGLLLIIIAAALAGLFSGGYFSETSLSNATNSLKVDYQRFGRLQNQIQLKITSHRPDAGRYLLRIGHDYTARFETENIWPQPDEMYSEGADLLLVYNKVKSQGDFSVWLYTSPDRPGKAVTSVTVNNEPAVSFWQFIYP